MTKVKEEEEGINYPLPPKGYMRRENGILFTCVLMAMCVAANRILHKYIETNSKCYDITYV